MTAEEAVQFVGSGDAVYLSSAGSVPKNLVDALCTRARLGGLSNVTLRHIPYGRDHELRGGGV